MDKRKASKRLLKSSKAKGKPVRSHRFFHSDLARFPAENPNPVFRLNWDGRIMYANDASQVILRNWGCQVGGYAPKFWRDLSSKILTRRASRTIDIEYDKKVYSFFLTPIADRKYVNIYANDITARRLADERLRSSEQRLRDIIENIPVGISITTPDKKVTITNRTLWKMFGYDSGKGFLEVLLRSPSRLFVDIDDREIFYGEMAKKGIIRDMEIRYRRKNGTEFWGSVTSITTVNEAGKVQYLNIIQDITSRKMAEEEKLKAVNQAASSIAHDIRNPLSSIRTAVYLLRSCSEEDRLDMLKMIDRNIVYADLLLKNLLDFSTAQKYEFVEEDLNALLRETLDQTAVPENVRLSARYGNIPPIKLDRGILARAFTNLIMNAIQAMPDGGGLDISTEQKGDFLELRIIDTGVGMTSETLKKVFEPFFTTKAKGIGLGLYNVKRAIEGHGGTIVLNSEENNGSTAIIRLPIG